MERDLTEHRLRGEELFCGRVLRLHRDEVGLPDGTESVREVIRHDGAVCVIPLLADGRAVTVSQYRYAQGRVMREIPAGKLEKGEDPAACALRELEEETGYRAGRLIPLGLYVGSPAILDEPIRMYAALDLTEGEANPDEGELLEVEATPLRELVDAVLAGEIADGKTQVAVLRLYLMLSEGRL